MGAALTVNHYLVLGAILFAISVVGIFLNRRNLIVLLMAIELMLLAVNLNFIAFSHFLGDIAGQVFVFFILTVAAAESAIGLAILVVLFRNLNTHRRRGPRHAKGMKEPLPHRRRSRRSPARIVAGLFGRAIGRAGAHSVTIFSVLLSFLASCWIFARRAERQQPSTASRSTPG